MSSTSNKRVIVKELGPVPYAWLPSIADAESDSDVVVVARNTYNLQKMMVWKPGVVLIDPEALERLPEPVRQNKRVLLLLKSERLTWLEQQAEQWPGGACFYYIGKPDDQPAKT